MGKRGPKKTPTPLLKLRDSHRVSDRKNEPQPDKTIPICPRWLNADAKKVWAVLTPKLKKMGVLTTVDGNALARYCDAWARWKKMAKFMDTMGEVYTIKDSNGNPKYLQQAPQVGIYNKLCTTLAKLEAEFGLTPSARSSINTEKSSTNKEAGKGRFFSAG